MATTTILSKFPPLCISTTSIILSKFPFRKPHFTSIPTPSLFFSHSFSSLTPSTTKALTSNLSFPQLEYQQEQDPEPELELEPELDSVIEHEIKDSETEEEHKTAKEKKTVVVSEAEERLPLPNLTVKEKKDLASHAHSLGKKLKCQLVGKSGVTDGVVSSFIETLEANELLKIKIHGTCPGELEDVVKQLEEATGSVVVGQIGRTVIVYRPSLTKMKLEEKKREALRAYLKKKSKRRPPLEKKAKVTRISRRGCRGSSRFSSLASD